jgi:uncharacterized RDD family membrane protein YckC
VVDCVIAFAILAPIGVAFALLTDKRPETGPDVYRALLLNFSIPVWLYFILSDASAGGATLAKRLFGIRVRRGNAARVSLPRALVRTAVKLLPWETVHLAAFALSTAPETFNTAQWTVLIIGNVLWLVYAGTALVNRGRRSVHDYVAGTYVSKSDVPTTPAP